MLLLALGSVLLRPPVSVRAVALAAVVLLFVGLRRGIGNFIQRRCFMAVDFDKVSVRNIRNVPRELFDRADVHLVETTVVPKVPVPSNTPQHAAAAADQ